MAGKLVQVATETLTSASPLIDFGGVIDSDDVYMLLINNVAPVTDSRDIKIRVTESGTANSTANYDYAFVRLRTDTTFSKNAATNENQYDVSTGIGNATGEQCSAIIYIYNAYNSSEYTFFSQEQIQLSPTTLLIGSQGGGVFHSASQVDGIEIFCEVGASNFKAGSQFTMYKVV